MVPSISSCGQGDRSWREWRDNVVGRTSAAAGGGGGRLRGRSDPGGLLAHGLAGERALRLHPEPDAILRRRDCALRRALRRERNGQGDLRGDGHEQRAGHVRDTQPGICHNREVALADPAGLAAVDFANPQSLNRYAYALNNPTTLIDPTGLCGETYYTYTYDSNGNLVDSSGPTYGEPCPDFSVWPTC